MNQAASTVQRQAPADQRGAVRRALALPARVIWRDRSGTTRITNVITRDVSETGVFVDCPEEVAIPLYRLAYFQIARDARNQAALPDVLRQPEVLAAVYRVETRQSSARTVYSYALRLLVEPARKDVKTSETGDTKRTGWDWPRSRQRYPVAVVS